MQFHEKLDLLMKIQNVTNIRLARSLSVDPSLVSRWRTGARKPSQKNDYIKEISTYFTAHAKMEFQKAALYEIMGLEINKSQNSLYPIQDLLYTWLTDKKSPEKIFAEKFFDNLNKKNTTSFNKTINNKKTINDRKKINDLDVEAGKKEIEILNGIEGKRKGVIKFLQAAAAEKEQITLLLYSNENTKWLTADREFYQKWGMLLKNVIAKGHKIKIIHTIKREISEILAAIDYWMPFYLTGAVEPYYYPKYQENIFRRTMFIAPGKAALNCSTVSEYSDKAQQFLYWNPEKIDLLAEEYNTFLKRCRPLMRIYTGKNTYNFNQLQIEFDEQQAEMISISDMPSFVTMPDSLLVKFLEKNKADQKVKESVLYIYKQRSKAFISNLFDNKYYEIINLPSKEDFLNKKNSLNINDFFSELTFKYSFSDFYDHLQHIIQLLEKHNNYHLLLTDDFSYQNIKLAVKDEVGSLISRNDEKEIIIAFNQPNITNSFFTYLKYMIREIPNKEKNKARVINRLNNYLDKTSE
jgi:hypothetical protein